MKKGGVVRIIVVVLVVILAICPKKIGGRKWEWNNFLL